MAPKTLFYLLRPLYYYTPRLPTASLHTLEIFSAATEAVEVVQCKCLCWEIVNNYPHYFEVPYYNYCIVDPILIIKAPEKETALGFIDITETMQTALGMCVRVSAAVHVGVHFNTYNTTESAHGARLAQAESVVSGEHGYTRCGRAGVARKLLNYRVWQF